MTNIFSYRKIIAGFLAFWMSAIIVSGSLFIHKEVTSTGEIVIHNHPYDFTNKKHKHHHQNDAEVHFLDILFYGSFLGTSFVSFEVPFLQEYPYNVQHKPYESHALDLTQRNYDLRGPPSFS